MKKKEPVSGKRSMPRGHKTRRRGARVVKVDPGGRPLQQQKSDRFGRGFTSACGTSQGLGESSCPAIGLPSSSLSADFNRLDGSWIVCAGLLAFPLWFPALTSVGIAMCEYRSLHPFVSHRGLCFLFPPALQHFAGLLPGHQSLSSC